MSEENEQKISTLKNELKKLENNDSYMSEFMNHYNKYQGLETLSRDVVADLVDEILICEDKGIRIEFKFQDEMKRYIF